MDQFSIVLGCSHLTERVLTAARCNDARGQSMNLGLESSFRTIDLVSRWITRTVVAHSALILLSEAVV